MRDVLFQTVLGSDFRGRRLTIKSSKEQYGLLCTWNDQNQYEER